jgi:cobalt-zinc-cadmium efflux system protein
MGHDHAHDHGGRGARHLFFSFVITLSFMLVEAAGGWLTNSLALLSDAGHMLTDAGALGFSLLAFRLGAKPPSATHTFGYRRFEVLAALLNGLALWAIVGVILHEVWDRIQSPPDVKATGMIAVAGLGLVVNLVSIALLHAHKDENLNIRGAFLHVTADSLGSVGALIAGITIFYTSWFWIDPLVSLGICLLILWSSWGLVRDSVHILLLGVPAHLDYQEIEQEILGHPEVCCIYDLHIWSISSQQDALSAHVVVPDNFGDQKELLKKITRSLRKRFSLEHATLQLEESHEMRDRRAGICKVDTACTACSFPNETCRLKEQAGSAEPSI